MHNDLRFAFRMFRKNPGFTSLIVLTLALGIGGTTAIFSVIQCGMLDPFPYADSHRLAVLVTRNHRTGANDRWAWVSGREFLDYQEQNNVFDEVFGATWSRVVMKGVEGAILLDGSPVTPNFFRVLGVPSLIGRTLVPEDAKPGAPSVAVLSFNGWRTHFGEDPGVIGKAFVISDRPTTIVGVMPPRFMWQKADIWLPATPSREIPDQSFRSSYSVVGRLKPGVSIREANAGVELLAKRFAAARPEEHPKEITFQVDSLPTAAMGRSFRVTLYFLLGAVGLLLLIACGNVANMLFARATEREKELSIRASLGASRPRLLRQLIVESLLFAVCGGAAGTLVAVHLLDGILAVMPPGLPDEALVRVNGPVLLFTLAVTLMCTLISGLMPALQVVGRDLQDPLKAAGTRSGENPRHHRLRNLLVASEVALSLVLLTGAGLLMRSFIALHQIDLGFDGNQMLAGGTVLPETRYKTAEQRVQFQLEALGRVRALPGVQVAALGHGGGSVAIEIYGKPNLDTQETGLVYGGDRSLEVARVPLLKGRSFSEEDLSHTRNVAMVNQAFVNKFFGGANPLGERVRVKKFPGWVGSADTRTPWFEIVGVFGDFRNQGLEVPTAPDLNIPYTVGGIQPVSFTLRSGVDPVRLAKSVQQIIWSMDKELLVNFNPRTMKENFDRAYFSQPRFLTTISVAFASLGLILVSIGVYSVLFYAVSRRTQEIGIRMALGAQAADVRRMVMVWGLRWLAIGIGVGVPASMALARILQSRIWGIKSADPVTIVVVSLVLTAVGLTACFFPARRATKVDPMVALRYE